MRCVPWVMAEPAFKAAAMTTASEISASVAPASRARLPWISRQYGHCVVSATPRAMSSLYFTGIAPGAIAALSKAQTAFIPSGAPASRCFRCASLDMSCIDRFLVPLARPDKSAFDYRAQGAAGRLATSPCAGLRKIGRAQHDRRAGPVVFLRGLVQNRRQVRRKPAEGMHLLRPAKGEVALQRLAGDLADDLGAAIVAAEPDGEAAGIEGFLEWHESQGHRRLPRAGHDGAPIISSVSDLHNDWPAPVVLELA